MLIFFTQKKKTKRFSLLVINKMLVAPDMSKLEPFFGNHYKRWYERKYFILSRFMLVMSFSMIVYLMKIISLFVLPLLEYMKGTYAFVEVTFYITCITLQTKFRRLWKRSTRKMLVLKYMFLVGSLTINW